MTQDQSITFFIDRCLGKKFIVETLKNAGISIEIHDDHFAPDAQDVDWMAQVGKKGWVVLTKDARIGRNSLEKIAVASAHIKMFTLASQSISGQEMAEIFFRSDCANARICSEASRSIYCQSLS